MIFSTKCMYVWIAALSNKPITASAPRSRTDCTLCELPTTPTTFIPLAFPSCTNALPTPVIRYFET